MKITIDAGDIPVIVDMIDAYPERAKQAMVTSINRSIAGIRSDSAKSVTGTHNIKQKDVRAVTAIYKASLSRLLGEVTLKGKPIGLEKFSPTPRVLGKKRPKNGVTVRIKRGEKTVISGSFLGMSRFGGNNLQVLKRTVQSRLPIRHLTGPSVAQMVSKSEETQLYESAKERFTKSFIHMINEGYKHVKERKRT